MANIIIEKDPNDLKFALGSANATVDGKRRIFIKRFEPVTNEPFVITTDSTNTYYVEYLRNVERLIKELKAKKDQAENEFVEAAIDREIKTLYFCISQKECKLDSMYRVLLPEMIDEFIPEDRKVRINSTVEKLAVFANDEIKENYLKENTNFYRR